jgi:hypothetical protein
MLDKPLLLMSDPILGSDGSNWRLAVSLSHVHFKDNGTLPAETKLSAWLCEAMLAEVHPLTVDGQPTWQLVHNRKHSKRQDAWHPVLLHKIKECKNLPRSKSNNKWLILAHQLLGSGEIRLQVQHSEGLMVWLTQKLSKKDVETTPVFRRSVDINGTGVGQVGPSCIGIDEEDYLLDWLEGPDGDHREDLAMVIHMCAKTIIDLAAHCGTSGTEAATRALDDVNTLIAGFSEDKRQMVIQKLKSTRDNLDMVLSRSSI